MAATTYTQSLSLKYTYISNTTSVFYTSFVNYTELSMKPAYLTIYYLPSSNDVYVITTNTDISYDRKLSNLAIIYTNDA